MCRYGVSVSKSARSATLSDAQALVDTLADSLEEVKAETLADAQAPVDTVADSLAEVDVETLG